jgi:pimeloyl-ACP methyl ester carboxylesterase
MSFTAIESRLPDDIILIRQPTLVIWGESDNLIPLVVGERLAVEIPRGTLEVIAGAGHSPFEDSPAEVARLIVSFLERE